MDDAEEDYEATENEDLDDSFESITELAEELNNFSDDSELSNLYWSVQNRRDIPTADSIKALKQMMELLTEDRIQELRENKENEADPEEDDDEGDEDE